MGRGNRAKANLALFVQVVTRQWMGPSRLCKCGCLQMVAQQQQFQGCPEVAEAQRTWWGDSSTLEQFATTASLGLGTLGP
jgi:hypothetical protein